MKAEDDMTWKPRYGDCVMAALEPCSNQRWNDGGRTGAAPPLPSWRGRIAKLFEQTIENGKITA